MSTSSNVLSEEQFLCSVCLDVFTEPVSIPCGHNFCKACISEYWNTTALCQCPLCKDTFNRRPDLKTNTTLRDVADHFKRMKVSDREESSSKPGEVAQVQQMIQERLQTVKEIKLSVELSQRDAEREIAGSVEVFTALVRSIERSQAELIEVVEEKQKEAQRQAEGLIEKLEQEITELLRRGTELDHLHQNSPSPIKDWSEISVHRDLHVGTVRRALSQLEEMLHNEMEKSCNAELKMIQQWSVNVTLDPDTAHPKLIVSKNRKQVSYGDIRQNIPDNPKRFGRYLSVLGKKGFSSGRFYFEVQVRGKIEWEVGVARESIIRKGPTVKSPDAGLWTVNMKGENKYEIMDTPPIPLFLDPDTAHPKLIVSENRKQVSFQGTWRNIPDNPKMFSTRLAVLGKEGFFSGRFYFEVQVRGKIEWEVGVARESIIRKGPTAVSPEGGLWALYMKGENKYEIKGTPPNPLFLSQKPQKVGVFVDYEEGQISFYDVENRSHIYSFTGCTFTEKLYPYLNPCDNSEGPNSAPLVISPVNHTDCIGVQ